MKKFISAIILLILSGTVSFSKDIPLINPNNGPKDAISLVYGDPSCLNDPNVKIAFFISFEDAEIVDFDREYNVEKSYGSIDKFNAGRGENFTKDWPTNYMMMNVEAVKEMDKTFKASIKLANEAPDAKYTMLIHIGKFDFGHFVAVGGIKDGGTITKGLIEIADYKTGDPVAVFDLNYHRSKNVGYGNNDRLRKYAQLMSKEIKKLIK